MGSFPSIAAPDRKWRVNYEGGIEPLVRLIETTDRERCVEVVGEKIARGTSYRDFMAAVFLAGLRNGGDTGYYHCIYVIHAANQLAATTPIGEQVLPLFGALDLFKGWQARRTTEPGHFGMQPLPKKLADTKHAVEQFRAAARASDQDGVEAAALALSESVGRQELFRLFSRQALLGGAVHRSILVSNCWRVLQAMNWHHFRPTLRAISRMLAADNGMQEEWFVPLRKRAEATHGALPKSWSQTKGHPEFTRDLLESMRAGDSRAAVEAAIKALFTGKVSAQALWDAAHLAGAESLIRYGEGNALHENTSLNALHYAYRTIAQEEDRLLIVLAVVKGAAENYRRHGEASGKPSILQLTATDPRPSLDEAVKDVVSTTVDNGAVQKAFTLVQSEQGGQALAAGLRQLVVKKARNDAHPYKLIVANAEDTRVVSSTWRPHLAAAPIGLQRGGEVDITDNPDSKVILQAREILRR